MADPTFFQLRITGPEGAAWLVRLPAAPVHIGSQQTAEIVLDHPDVAPYHALVNPVTQACQIMDLGGAGGTWLDQKRLTSHSVANMLPGSVLMVGPFQLTCEQRPGAPPKTAVVEGRPQPSAPDTQADRPGSSNGPAGAVSQPQVETNGAVSQPPANGAAAAVSSQAQQARVPGEKADDVSVLFRRKALEKLQSPEQLNELMTTTSAKSWLVLLALLALLAGAAGAAFLGVVETTVAGSGMLVASAQDPQRLEAVLYVAPADAPRIQPGMPVRLEPVSVRKEQYGMLVGQVTGVGSAPSTIAELQTTLGNDALAQSLIGTGALVEVRVALPEDPATATTYRWTSTSGPPLPLRAATIASGQLVVSRDRPIALVFSVER